MTTRGMNMEQIRGRVPLNIDYSNNISNGLIGGHAANRDLHHNMNYNIFEEPVYINPSKQAEEYVSHSNPNSVDLTQQNVNRFTSETGSPYR